MGENSAGPALSVSGRLKVGGTILVVLLAVWAALLGARLLMDRTGPPEYPAEDVRDWATFADHLVLGTAEDDGLEITAVLWSRQGAHPIGRRVSFEAELSAGAAYAVPVAWTGGDDGRWVALAPEAVVPIDGGRIDAGHETWVGDITGKSPRALAAELYETGPYPAAVPHLYESLEQRLAAVER
ncbi:hypothetical protein J2S40_003279 [Nocardioides luteus]|uniref:Uncharacterized protein n=1 Tax=Nocardioides luteus TaxID=1844 RepID=A0ABQ5SY35_9ACTN|nr:hypothetical protein [Nocardioides luteus]MDR7312221.1 hypothetical protein [Nocardioides luteus]GGR56793.1 hypothetical protein GCM10010197_24460 [Nocardioides luteus]GLJ68468.1 hypothetical protein GCM10017579_25040 [Nocardioides luteus]